MGSEPVDRFLEEALAAYSCAEPRPGIEGRILARAAAVRWRWRWMAAGLSVSAFAAVCAAVLLIAPKPGIRIVPLPIQAARTPALLPAPPRTQDKRFVLPAPLKVAPLTPAPLTKEEREWMSLGESGVLASVESGDLAPLRVDELTIPPLESEGGE